MENNIASDKVFAMAQFFNVLQFYLALQFPQAITIRGEALIAGKRIEEFLLMEEIQESFRDPLDWKSKEANTGLVKLDHVYASWEEESIIPTLSDVTLHLKPGQLCAVVGTVGAGKSSLLNLLLKELPVSKGFMDVNGKIAFSSQESWLFQGSVRNNILFGQTYNKHRYNATVKACALARDFEQVRHRLRLEFGFST